MMDPRYVEAWVGEALRASPSGKNCLGFMAYVGMPIVYDFDIYCARSKEDYELAKTEKFKFLAKHKHDTSLV